MPGIPNVDGISSMSDALMAAAEAVAAAASAVYFRRRFAEEKRKEADGVATSSVAPRPPTVGRAGRGHPNIKEKPRKTV